MGDLTFLPNECRNRYSETVFLTFSIDSHLSCNDHPSWFFIFLVQITNEIHSKRPLELTERQQIISSIQEDNQGHYTKYNQLAYTLGDRTREFIYNQWLHIDPSCKRGRWSNDEQAQLLSHINQQTQSITNWPLVSAPVRTRSSRQCRERALDTLKNGNRPTREKHRLFTAEEDRLLLEQYEVYGAKWSMIAKEFSSRTDNSLLVRYRMLSKARSQWNWFCQINPRMKTFLIFLYDKQTTTKKILADGSSIDQQDIRQDVEQFGFYRRGLPLPITDEEFQWFNEKPEFIENIARIALDEFSQKRLCCRKFKVKKSNENLLDLIFLILGGNQTLVYFSSHFRYYG